MRPVEVQVGATGTSRWIEVDYMAAPFGIGFRCSIGGATGGTGGTGGGLTYSVQHAFCQMSVPQTDITLARSSTTATLTFRSMQLGGDDTRVTGQPHGLAIGDAVAIQGVGVPFDGQYDVVTVPSPTSLTFTVANTGLTSNALASGQVFRLFVGTHPVVAGLTGSSDGNYGFPPNYVRTSVTAWASGVLTFSMNQGTQS